MSYFFFVVNYKAHRMYDGDPPPPFQNVNIVTFQIGELIQVLEQVTSEWWKVSVTNCTLW